MFYFNKKISYFDYYENGERKKSCGYAKVLVKDNAATIEIQIKDAGKESCMCEILAIGNSNIPIGRFFIDKGTGYYNTCYQCENLDGKGLSLFDTAGLKLAVSENKYCEAFWEWKDRPLPAPKEEVIPEREKVTGQEAVSELENVPEPEEVAELREAEEHEEIPASKSTNVSEIVEMPKAELVSEEKEALKPEAESDSEEESEVPLYENKWQQLCSTYPVCHPFGDEDEYISITPKDFVVLRKEYQNLVSNSFLLHSFYNYQHVILGKMGNDEVYYIGVPGIYFDRDKKVAVMFGFEGFARSATDGYRKGNEAAASGDFGYYMRRVEI